MKYEHWTKIDDGAEGAWAADIWMNALRIINRHEGESIYDASSPIYVELEQEIPELTWRSFEGDAFRPYFRDFSKPWTIPNVASFDTFFKVTELGKKLLNGKFTELEFWIQFLAGYKEGIDFPFSELSCAFLKTEKSLSIDEVYWGVVRNFREENNDQLIFDNLIDEAIPSTAKRRLALMLHLMERTGAILKIGSGSKQRWKQWDRRVLDKINKRSIRNQPRFGCYNAINKPFLLLAGISGTGKTRFVREQAKISSQFDETYCLTSVRPDWHEPSDLLGYISRLGKSGQAEYIATDVLKFIAKAWRGIANNGLTIEVQNTEGKGDRLVVSDDSDALKQVLPYWLCLDEMNLAPVEQYFADYLSVLETREWKWNGDSFTYSSDALLKPSVLTLRDENGNIDKTYDNKLRASLGFEDSKYDDLWQGFCRYGLGIPFNLIVAGTVNMDETTHGFSRKVIDRALTFDFGEFFPNDFDAFFEEEEQAQKCPITLGYPIASQARQSSVVAKASRDFLNVINNGALKNTPFELAYRALNELLLSVQSFAPNDGEQEKLQAIWDDFLMMKVLPRIEGDDEKAADVLAKLEQLLSVQLKAIWSDEAKRPDLWRDTKEYIPCRSKKKIAWMRARLSAGFTSFWP